MKKFCLALSLFLPITNYALSPLRKNIVDYARKHNGTPYVFGGEDIVNGIDCSAFVQKVMKENGIELPRTARQQYQHGRKLQVPPERLYPADLVFFQTYRPGASHVGIYSDKDGEFIHASSSRGISSALMTNPWWSPRYLGAKRLIEIEKETSSSQEKKAKDAPKKEKSKEVVNKEVAKAKTKTKKGEEKAKTTMKPKEKSLKEASQEIAEFQKKASFLKEHQKRVKKIHKWVMKNKSLAGRVCPQLYKYPLKTFLYDTSFRTERMRKALKFGSELILIGGSKPKKILGKREVAKACVVLPNNKIDLINAKALSIFPAKGLVAPACKNLKKGATSLQVRVNKAPLEMHFLEYENVYGDMIKPVKIKARWVGKNKKLKALGTVRRGRQAGDYCVDYKGNIFSIYSNNVRKI